MRVLQVVGSAEGGVRRHLVQLIGNLTQHRFVVAGPSEVVHGLGSFPTVEDLWPLPAGGTLWAAWGARRTLQGRLGVGPARPFDLAHIHGWRAAWPLLTLPGLRLPVVWTLHTRPPGRAWMRAGIGRLLRAGERLPFRLIAVSRSLAQEVAQIWPECSPRLEAVRNGLDREEMEALALQRRQGPAARLHWSPETTDDSWTGPSSSAPGARPVVELPLPMPILGYMGRLWGPKGVFDAVEVLARLVQAGWPAVLAVAGEGPHQAAMARLADARGVGQRLHFLGWQKPGAFLAQIDLLVHPSRAEGGFPYTIIEAMAAGVPVVGYRLPPLQEVVEAGEAAAGGQELLHLVPPGDVAELARRCATCLNHAERTARQAQAAATFARRAFTLDRTLAAVERIYHQAVREAAFPSRQGERLGPEPGLAGPDQVRV